MVVFCYIPFPIFTHTTGMTHFLDVYSELYFNEDRAIWNVVRLAQTVRVVRTGLVLAIGESRGGEEYINY